MSDTTATTPQETAPAAPAADVKPAAPVEPVEKPFTTDVLTSCTSRFTRKAWDIFLIYNKESDLKRIKTAPLRNRLEALTPEGAQEIKTILQEAGVTELTLRDKVIEYTAPFATTQLVIKNPQTHVFDAVEV